MDQGTAASLGYQWVIQAGNSNTANVHQNGIDEYGRLFQYGDSNVGSIDQNDSLGGNNNALITQNTSGNTAGIVQTGGPNNFGQIIQ